MEVFIRCGIDTVPVLTTTSGAFQFGGTAVYVSLPLPVQPSVEPR